MSQLQTLWDEFLAIWPLSRIEQMSLSEYTATQDKTTFTYWVETQTQPLANIKGSPSTKFGIYKRDPAKEVKDQSGMLHGVQYSWRDRFGDTEQQAFTAIRSQIIQVIQAAQRGDLDAIEEVPLAPVYKWKIAFLYQNQAKPCIVNIFAKDKLAELTALPKNAGYPAFYRQLIHAYSAQSYENIAEYGRECWMQLAQDSDVDENGERPSALQQQHNEEQSDCKMALNQILYGPPGTGKTYHTIEAAVKAAEPTFRWTTREQLKAEYDRLISQKRIRFVTFHQSYGYEEFVEGLTATTTEGQVSYEIKAGLFKNICEEAAQGVESEKDPLEIAITSLKADLEDGASLSLMTQRGKPLDIQYHGNTTFRAFPRESSYEDLGNGYPVAIDSIRKLYRGSNAKEFYNPSYVKAILKHLIAAYQLPEYPTPREQNVKNFVLIIDEINRGNISKIFGELITLIEPSKRAGQKEALELVLPYSGDSLSVPSNLYIIGTMNTADRSLAMMDTALRRRFDFVQMMPKPELLAGIKVQGIDLQCLLYTLNQRIEILYDREHVLGHAFFMPIKTLVEAGEQNLAFEALITVFKNKVIPLLEEYFFEDWSKIRLVLADNQKPVHLQFITQHMQNTQELNALFGSQHSLEQYGQQVIKYTLVPDVASVWLEPMAYQAIYQVVSNEISNQLLSYSEDAVEQER